jgi:hypothetical protein
VAPARRPRDPNEPESEFDYFKRRLHNTQRAGRNRLYYEVLNRAGPTEAAKYWAPKPDKQNPPKLLRGLKFFA